MSLQLVLVDCHQGACETRVSGSRLTSSGGDHMSIATL